MRLRPAASEAHATSHRKSAINDGVPLLCKIAWKDPVQVASWLLAFFFIYIYNYFVFAIFNMNSSAMS